MLRMCVHIGNFAPGRDSGVCGVYACICVCMYAWNVRCAWYLRQPATVNGCNACINVGMSTCVYVWPTVFVCACACVCPFMCVCVNACMY